MFQPLEVYDNWTEDDYKQIKDKWVLFLIYLFFLIIYLYLFMNAVSESDIRATLQNDRIQELLILKAVSLSVLSLNQIFFTQLFPWQQFTCLQLWSSGAVL